jgi:hypothetical protein
MKPFFVSKVFIELTVVATPDGEFTQGSISDPHVPGFVGLGFARSNDRALAFALQDLADKLLGRKPFDLIGEGNERVIYTPRER